MAIIERRVFYAKAGAAEPLVAVLQEGMMKVFAERGYGAKVRVLTDYMSGRSDRVVQEVEVPSIGDIEAVVGKLMADPKAGAELLALQKKIFELVEFSEVEHWAIR
ncbi:MAG: hypothetical protein HY331_08885 [Chloroflexi bacterium]|nr:hypothetical protein [Chloroflexota bacterium]